MRNKNRVGTSAKTLDEYLKLPWTLAFLAAPDEGGFVAKVMELPGCISEGDTLEEAHAMIRDALEGWLASALKHGDPIPVPGEQQDEYSGNFRVRLPKSVHRALVENARREGVSLNTYTVSKLSEAVGAARAAR